MSPKAEVVARNQEAKRHELDNRMRAIAFDHKAGIAGKVRCILWLVDLGFRRGQRTAAERISKVVEHVFEILCTGTIVGMDPFPPSGHK